MLRAILLGALLVVPACSKGAGGGGGPAVVAGARVGTVLELTGKVIATRDGTPRELAVGDAVAGDDVIATSAEASVAIELLHNNARWNLGANKTSKVSESSAWTLAKAAKPAEAVAGDTSAAGRHAERSSAETASTVARNEAAAAPPMAEPVTTAPSTPSTPSAGSPAADHASDKGGAAPPPTKAVTRPKSAPKRALDLGAPGGGIRGQGGGGGGTGMGGSIGGSIGTSTGAGANPNKKTTPPRDEQEETTRAPSPPPPPKDMPKAPAPATTPAQAEKAIRGSAAIKACLGTVAETPLAVTCAAGTCKVTDAKLDAKSRLCVETAINQLGFVGSVAVKTTLTK